LAGRDGGIQEDQTDDGTGNPVTELDTPLEQDLRRRRAAVRRTEILLKVEQWGLRYVGDLVDATAEERAWLEQYVAANGEPPDGNRTAEQWSQLRREQAGQANAAASAAFLAGDYDTARDLIDDARAHGGLMETEWVRLHQFIATRTTAKPDTGEIPAQRAA
jgi:predicted Zn-dependent protease